MKRYEELVQKRADLAAEGEKLAELDNPTDEQKARAAAIPDEIDAVDAELKPLIRLREQQRNAPIIPDPLMPTSEPQVSVRPNYEDDPMGGFKDHAEFLTSVMNATRFGRVDERLQAIRAMKVGATAGSDEQHTLADPYGGFSIPTQLAAGIRMVGLDEGGFAGMAQNIPMQTDKISIPAKVDKDHSSSVSGGLTVARHADTQSITASRMEMELVDIQAFELIGLSYASELLLRASPLSWVTLIQNGFGDEFRAKLINEMINGTGIGEFLGVLNSPALIAVAKETSQTADTLKGINIAKMRAEAWRYNQCVWIANPDAYTQLIEIHISGTNSDSFLFVPARGIDVPDTLLGRPIYFSDYAQTLGDQGDIMLINWNEYIIGTLHGILSAESIHVRFENNERTFKFWMANGGAPWWRSALTPAVSSTTRSPYVTLAERA